MNTLFILYEDYKISNFNPLVHLRPQFDLQCGALTILDKLKLRSDERNLALVVRDEMRKYTESLYDNIPVNRIPTEYERRIFINSRLLLDNFVFNQIIQLDNNKALSSKGQILAFRNDDFSENEITSLMTPDFEASFLTSDIHEIDAELLNYIWDLIYANGTQLDKDIKFLVNSDKFSTEKIDQEFFKINEQLIFLGNNVKIAPNALLDASKGPILIDNDCEVMAGSVIYGPCFIGNNTKIKAGAKIYGPVSICSTCKIGGEVEDSIILSFSNKQHEGFLGHSYLGSWVNIGADTNNSDLKNNYGEITVVLDGKKINSGKQFLGLIMGDHSKTAINTQFNTGTIVGVSSNIFGTGFPPKSIPSFAWGGYDDSKYDIDKAIEVAEKVMIRRNKTLSIFETELLKNLYSQS
ncbi:MAG: hypothetical protein J5I57_03855 [Melioribacteraceae bacterium]|nr:hypothetical protein [Melioribacteraceae bacterium]